MNSIQAVAMPQVIWDDISVCSEEYHSDYFIAAPSCDYDSQNRLIRYDDSALNVTYVYTYDNRGNILNYRYMDYVPAGTSVSETGGDTYTYSYTNNVFKDAVTAINGESITYDSSYNPLKWTNGRTLTWVQGRRLETVTDGSTVTTYTYDENGIRIAKNVSSGGRSTQYYVADGTYLGEKTTYRGVTFLITYLYGDSGIVGIEVNGTKYFFVKNLQGDVTGIIDSTGAVIANYAYDAYGFCYSVTDASGNDITSPAHIANLNPFRYRSYMYDTETGFYYLTTRYYDPDVGRFLNADAYVSTGVGLDGYNMFAYCNSNPIMFSDPNGDCPWTVEHIRNCIKYPINDPRIEYCDVPHDMKHVFFARVRDKEKANPQNISLDSSKSLSENYEGVHEMSIIARMLYGEDFSSIGAHMWLLENRLIAGNYDGASYRELILSDRFGVQFIAMTDSRALNPASLMGNSAEKAAWDACVDAVFFYRVYGISYFDDYKHGYTYSKAYNDNCPYIYPGGKLMGKTWFHN